MRLRINLFQSLSTQRSLHKEFSQTSPELYISLHSVLQNIHVVYVYIIKYLLHSKVPIYKS